MRVCRRKILAGAGAMALIGICGVRPASAKDKLTEANMTKKDYDKITETRSSVEGEKPTAPPTPVHDLSDANAKAMKDEDGVRLLKGKDWTKKTPEERDAYLRNVKKTLPANSRLVLTVPKGELWVVDGESLDKLKKDGAVREWTDAEREKLPKTVPSDGFSHSDIRGTPLTRPVRVDIRP